MKKSLFIVILSITFNLSCLFGSDISYDKKLVFGVIRTNKDIKLQQKIDSIVKYLQKELKVEIRVYYTVDSNLIIQGLKYNFIDFAYLDTLSLYNAISKNDIFTPIVKEYTQEERHSLLVVPKASNINYLTDIDSFDKIAISNDRLVSFLYLKKETLLSDVHLNFVSTYSSEKSLKNIVKSNYDFKENTRGIKPKTHKRDSKSKFVAALVDSDEYKKFLEEYSGNEYKIIWQTPKIPNNGIVINERLSFQIKENLTKALIEYHSKSLTSYTKFVKFDKKEYIGLKELLK